MKTLRSYVHGHWHEADSGFVSLVDPASEETVARASSRGIDFAAVLAHARGPGSAALRSLTFAQRGALLKEMSRVLRERRDELFAVSRLNSGTTAADASFDIDGGGGALAFYAGLSRTLGENAVLSEGDTVPLVKDGSFHAGHVLVPRPGAAVLINAFNFPAWGFAEKAACALLAGMPVIVKPATATAMLAERYVEIIIDAAVLPQGALQLVCGSTGDLLQRLGAHDVLAFTGSAATARMLRNQSNLVAANTRFNIEADSLNAAVLAPDVTEGATFDLFLRDVVREITQKTGQKCTAVRRIFVPRERLDAVQDALVARLHGVVTGNPAETSVTMGPLATQAQLEDALTGMRALGAVARRVLGSGTRVDGRGSPAGKGFFVEPTLFRADEPRAAATVHEREVFGPVATLMPYDGTAADAAQLVGLGGGMLVTSLYGDDLDWIRDFAMRGGAYAGRLYIGSADAAAAAPGSGAVYPHTQHGGPGRAGGGAELGGLVGLRLYMQRVALQGAPPVLAAAGRA
jgi:oxepin-CoA hydrolase/3-oxo-5,6-dehydrosuberyl-CoA semialdehyde dehydrogenase